MTSIRPWMFTDPPARRPLKIFASDPMLGRTAGNRVTVSVTNEPLRPGPVGERLAVIDYDGSQQCYYAPVDLDDPALLMQGGLDPTESDPRFHQQMTYAVALRTLENFDRALGRRITFKGRKLGLHPHGFYGANAYYDRAARGVLFGYFRADEDDPGANVPGQTVFTCLSHDVIAHEVTHAIVDRLRRHFMEPSNVDVLAFHEGFADIVALFQHFSYEQLLRDEIQRNRSDLRSRNLLVELARQYGYATGTGKALRSALDVPDRKLYESVTEPHKRGSILVAAVFDAFFNIYQQRIRDLLRIATGGSGLLPAGDLHPDLVGRIADEAARAAQSVLTMCIRAFEYLPPVDVTFGDFLRAIVTADYELVANSNDGPRAAMIEAFRLRGIHPENVASLGEEALLWPTAPALPPFPIDLLGDLITEAQQVGRGRQRADEERSTRVSSAPAADEAEGDEGPDVQEQFVVQLHAYATANAQGLCLDPARDIAIAGFHTSFRVGPNGQLLIEIVAQFTQIDQSDSMALGGLPLRGGTTVVAAADGSVRYIIAKPLPGTHLDAARQGQAQARVAAQRAYVDLCQERYSWIHMPDDERTPRPFMLEMADFRSLHGGF